MKAFSKEMLDEFKAEVVEALKPVLERHGLTLDISGGTFSSIGEYYSPRVVFQVDGADRLRWDRYALEMGFTSEDLGARFQYQGEEYEVTGLTLRERKLPVRAREVATGKEVCFREKSVQEALGKMRA